MKNVLTISKIKIVVISLVLSFLLIPCYAFADSSRDTSLDLSSKSLSEEFIMASTLQANALQATTYTTTDIYNLLYHCLREGSNSAYGAITEINNNLTYYVSGTNWTLADLTGMIWGKVGDIEDEIDYNNSLTSTTNSKLEYVFSAIEDTINIKWYTSNIYNTAFSTSISPWTDLTSTANNISQIYIKTTLSHYSLNPVLLRLFVPIYTNNLASIDFDLINVYNIRNNQYIDIKYTGDYYFEPTQFGTYIYLFDFNPQYSTPYVFYLKSNSNMTYNSNYLANAVYIPFDTLDYQIIKTAFNSSKSADGNDAIKKLADVYASDDLIQAKANQQTYEDEVISEFTGSGASASKTSDKNGLKSVSSNIKSGLNTGGSINNALAVFDTSNSLWQFFTSTTQNNVDTRSGSNSRSLNIRNSNDTILDFQSERDREYYTHLGE